MADSIRRLSQVASQRAKSANEEAKSAAEKQQEQLGKKKTLRQTQNGIESFKQDSSQRLTVGAASPFLATESKAVAAGLQKSKAAISSYLTGASGGTDPMGEMFIVLMDYLKLAQKEARNDKKQARSDGKLKLALKADKLELEKSKIQSAKSEAGERFDNAMNAANTEMVLGIASGAASVTSAVSALKDHAASINAEARKGGGNKAMAVDKRYLQLISWLNDKP